MPSRITAGVNTFTTLCLRFTCAPRFLPSWASFTGWTNDSKKAWQPQIEVCSLPFSPTFRQKIGGFLFFASTYFSANDLSFRQNFPNARNDHVEVCGLIYKILNTHFFTNIFFIPHHGRPWVFEV